MTNRTENATLSQELENTDNSFSRTRRKYKIPEYLLAMNESEKEMNHKIIRNMNKRINYLRNPRFAVDRPPTLYTQAPNATNGARENRFIADPPLVLFLDYAEGCVFERSLALTNVSPISQRVKFVPPATPEFTIAGVVYPSEIGLVAPGMSVLLKVRFHAASLADFDDEIKVLAEGQIAFIVPLQARKEHPSLTLENPLKCLACWVGERVDMVFRFKNKGGDAGFKFFAEREEDEEQQGEETFRLKNFMLYPREFVVRKGETQELYVCFYPKEEGLLIESVVLACDNKTSQVFSLEGRGNMAELQIAGLDDRMIDYAALEGSLSPEEIAEDLRKVYFEGVLTGVLTTRVVLIRNAASVRVQFHWAVFTSAATQSKIVITDAVNNRFTISPESGFFEPDEIKAFTITFDPPGPMPVYEFATLLLDDVPIQSIRNPPPGIAKNALSGAANPDGFSPQTLAPPFLGSNSSRPSVSYLEFELIGLVNLAKLILTPPFHIFSTPLYTGHRYPAQFTLRNDSAAVVRFNVELLAKSDNALSFEVTGGSQGEVIPRSALTLEIQVWSSKVLPRAKFGFKVAVENGEDLALGVAGSFRGPEVRFNSSELNYGLLRSYSTAHAELEVVNASDVEALVFFQLKSDRPIVPFLDDNQTAEEQELRDDSRLRVVPKIALLAPNERRKIAVSLDTLEQESYCEILDALVKDGPTASIFIRAQVQRVAVVLEPALISFDKMYAGLTYELNEKTPQQVILRNLGNLTTSFRFTEIERPGELFVTFDPKEATLPGKGTIVVTCRISPLKGGILKEVIMLAVEGLDQELGFELRGGVLGLSIDFELLDEEVQRSPTSTLRSPTAVLRSPMSQVIADEGTMNGGSSLERLEFFGVVINKWSTKQILLRNTSGIDTRFRCYFERFEPIVHKEDAPEKTARSGGSIGVGSIKFSVDTVFREREEKKVGVPTRPSAADSGNLLSKDIEETMNFSTVSGASLSHSRRMDKEARFYLRNNLGMALVAEPKAGVIAAHAEVIVKVTVFNDMCGTFEDVFVCEVNELPPFRFPTLVTVVGSPLTVTANQVGVSYTGANPFFTLGSIMSNYGPLVRSIRLQNTGPKDVRLDWKLYNLSTPTAIEEKDAMQRDFFDLKIVEPELGSSLIGKLEWNAIEPPQARDGPFIIEPMGRFVRGRKEEPFTIKFKAKQHGTYDAVLVGRPALVKGLVHLPDEPLDGDEVSLDDRNIGSVTLYLRATSIAPALFLDKATKLTGKKRIRFQKWALVTNPKERRSFLLKNNTNANLIFEVQVSGPFQLLTTFTNSPEKHLLSSLKSSATKLKKEAERYFNLVPSSYVQLEMTFVADVRDQTDWPISFRNYKNGALSILFANGDSQQIDLEGVLIRPVILLNTSGFEGGHPEDVVDFGLVHINNVVTKSLFISNPTPLPAQWRLSYVKYPTKKVVSDITLTKIEKEDLEKTDDATVWAFTVSEGSLSGNSIPLSTIPTGPALPSEITLGDNLNIRPQEIRVAFQPKKNIVYKSKFRITVQEGPSIDIILRGLGSYEENKEKF